MQKVLITGAAGFIGMHCSIRYIEEGWNVIGIDNLNDYYDVKLKKDRLECIKSKCKELNGGFEFINHDIDSEIWLKFEGHKFDLVIHLAAQAGVRYSVENPLAYFRSNISGFQKVLDFVRLNNIKSFLYASSSSVYGKTISVPFKENDSCNAPESYYAASKKVNETLAYSYWKTYGVKSIGLRFFTVYGPWGRPDMAPFIFTKAAFLKQTINVYNNGNQERDFTYIDDIIESVFRISLNNSQIEKAMVVNVGNGSPTPLMDFIRTIEDITCHKFSKIFMDEQVGDVAITYADIDLLKEITNYSPQVTLSEGLNSFISWFVNYYKLETNRLN